MLFALMVLRSFRHPSGIYKDLDVARARGVHILRSTSLIPVTALIKAEQITLDGAVSSTYHHGALYFFFYKA